jgi:hypothetical protein
MRELGLLSEIIEIILYGSFLCYVVWLYTPRAFSYLTSRRHLSWFVFCFCMGIFLGVYLSRQTVPAYLLLCSSTAEIHVNLFPGLFNQVSQACVSSDAWSSLYVKMNHLRCVLSVCAALVGILGGVLGYAILFFKRPQKNFC